MGLPIHFGRNCKQSSLFATAWRTITCAARVPRVSFHLIPERQALRQYLASDALSEWLARARRSLKFCEMQIHLPASSEALEAIHESVVPPVISTIVMLRLFARRQRASMSAYFTNALTPPTGLGLLASSLAAGNSRSGSAWLGRSQKDGLPTRAQRRGGLVAAPFQSEPKWKRVDL